MAAVFTDDNFQDEVLNSDVPVLVDFWATWCGPCQMMKPIVEELAKEFDGKMKIGGMDIEENPETPQKYGVMSIPTFKIFVKGEIVEEMVGAMSADDLRKKLEAHV